MAPADDHSPGCRGWGVAVRAAGVAPWRSWQPRQAAASARWRPSSTAASEPPGDDRRSRLRRLRQRLHPLRPQLPLVIILIVPMCLPAAIAGVWIAGLDNNIFTQIGLLVLVGRAASPPPAVTSAGRV